MNESPISKQLIEICTTASASRRKTQARKNSTSKSSEKNQMIKKLSKQKDNYLIELSETLKNLGI